MKKVVLLTLVLLICFLSMGLSVSAEALTDWTDNGAQAKQLSGGISFTPSKLGEIDYAVYNQGLDVKDIKVEITPSYCENETDNDSWISVNFMGVPSIFSLSNKASTPGFVVLYYNYSGTFRLTMDGYMKGILQDADSWRLLQKGTPMKMGQKNTIELKYDDKEGYYHIIVNDKQLDDNANLALVNPDTQKVTVTPDKIFPDGKAYVVIGTYTSAGKPASFTINSINGKSMGKANSSGSGSNAVSDTDSTAISDSSSNTDSSITSDTGSNTSNSTNNDVNNQEGNISSNESNISDSSQAAVSTSAGSENSNTGNIDGMAKENSNDSNNTLMVVIVITAIIVIGVVVFFVKGPAKKKK